MAAARPSVLRRIFEEMVKAARRTGTLRRVPLKGGAELVVSVRGDIITATIKRPGKPVGKTELETFRRHLGIPADAAVLTPPDQGMRVVDGVRVYFVTMQWRQETQ